MVSRCCDTESLLTLACVAKRQLDIVTHELKRRCRLDPEYEQHLKRDFQEYLVGLVGTTIVLYTPVLCRALEYKFTTWAAVTAYPTGILQRYLDANLIDPKAIYADAGLEFYHPATITQEIRNLPPMLLYQIWEVAFLGKNKKQSSDKQPTDKPKPETTKKLIYLMTDRVMAVFRTSLIINDRFVLKCFEHGLDSVLLYLYDNERFFKLSITTPKLEDLYIMLACDTGSVGMFLHFTRKIQRIHIEYALRHASNEFLMVVWKSRQYIPAFREHMQAIQADEDHPMKTRDFKQRTFLDWCITHP